MKTEDIVTTILMRERYRRDRMEYLARLFAVTCAVLALVTVSNVVLAMRGPLYRYVMTDSVGIVLDAVPLTQPNLPDEKVAEWTADSLTRIFTFDFINYRRQFGVAQTLLTATGWDGFVDMLKRSGNFNSVISNRFVTTASPSGSAKPRILSSGLVRDATGATRWAWTVEMPMVILFQNSKQQTSLNLTVQTVVVRVPEYIHKSGLGIRQIKSR